MSNVRLVEILLVEDNDLDAEMTMVAAEDSRLANRIARVSDGQQALDYLYRRPPFENAERPELILLDLNLPGIDGREVLHTVKEDEHLKSIPVVVMTTSADERDVLDSYNSGTNAYIRKPVQPDGFLKIVQMLEQFWFGIVVLPPDAEGQS